MHKITKEQSKNKFYLPSRPTISMETTQFCSYSSKAAYKETGWLYPHKTIKDRRQPDFSPEALVCQLLMYCKVELHILL